MCKEVRRGIRLTVLQVYDYLLLSFTEPWEIKYGNIQFLAALVHDLQRYHPEFSVSVVDQVMEDIRIGMEVSWHPMLLGSTLSMVFIS